MYRRMLWIFFLIVTLFLTGCRQKPAVPDEPEPTAVYDWMAGESPVPNRRIGTVRKDINIEEHAVSPAGVYFVRQETFHDGENLFGLDACYIFYADHGSDTFYKLCGRTDCTHDNEDCNAYLYRGSKLSYYRGHLYAVTGEGPYTEKCKLIRMSPDGSRHVTVFDFTEFAKEQGAEFAYIDMIADGYCEFHLYTWKEEEDGTQTGEWMKTYIYRVDGTMKEPYPLEAVGDPVYQCGDLLLALSGGPVEYKCWSMDLETGTSEYLTEFQENAIWFTVQEVYYLKDGVILKRSYETNEEEILVDTGLEGSYGCIAFPDCLVMASRDSGENADRNLYFYNWAFELVDAVELDFPLSDSAQFSIIAETADRVILTDGNSRGKTYYYIDKSELGTGNVEIHKFVYNG